MATGKLTTFKLRGRQPKWVDAIEKDFETYSRLLVVAPGGSGKTGIMGALAKRLFERTAQKTLILENRDRLTEQTAERVANETGLEVDIEKADQRASPHAQIVVGCVQSLGRANRLTGFSDDHFGLVVPDEAHFCLAPQWIRIMNYFHYGTQSLADGWIKPEDGLYVPKCKIAGFTASPDLGDRKNLGDVFQKLSVNYSYLDAIDDGWLVSLKEINVPVKIDTRKFRVKRSQDGDDFNAQDQAAMIEPIIEELADQIPIYAPNRKGIMFLPSVDTARRMADALNRRGVTAYFVSGECIDKNEKTDAFAASGPNTWLINCALYVYGVDFQDVDAIAPFAAIISKVKYIQAVYRSTRVLPGLVSDDMTAEERRAAIASSLKPYALVLSPFFISDRIHIMEPYDLFGIKADPKKPRRMEKDFTDVKKIRDYIAALEKAASLHKNKQARTINPIAFALSVKDNALINYKPESESDAAPPNEAELDFLLERGIDTTQIKNSGMAQRFISRLVERDRQGLASPKQLNFLLRLNIPEDRAVLMKKGQAGIIISRGWN